jgi:quinol monooxygenase YgiN
MMIVPKPALLAKLTAKDGQRDALLSVIADLGMRNVSGEAGTEVYVAHKDQNDENVVWFYEMYSDNEALTAHGGSDAMKKFGRSTGEYMASRAELIFLEPVCAKGLEL